jgi:hypothetical protein
MLPLARCVLASSSARLLCGLLTFLPGQGDSQGLPMSLVLWAAGCVNMCVAQRYRRHAALMLAHMTSMFAVLRSAQVLVQAAPCVLPAAP